MNKIKLEAGKGPFPILVAHPVVLVGSNVNEKPNFAAVAWVGVAASNPPAISVALQPHRYTLKGIHQNMTFSVNIPSSDQVKETDYCGLVSGSKTNKVKDTGFKIFYGELTTAPLIEQCPVNHACEVIQIISLGSHQLIVGRIKETYVSEDSFDGGRLDADKIKPFLMAMRGKYRAMGKSVGIPFRSGAVISPSKSAEGVAQAKKIGHRK